MKQQEIQLIISTLEQYSLVYQTEQSQGDILIFTRTWIFPNTQKTIIEAILNKQPQFAKIHNDQNNSNISVEISISDEEVFFMFKITKSSNLQTVLDFEDKYLGKINQLFSDIVDKTIFPIEQLLLKKQINSEDLFKVFDFMNQEGTEETIVYLAWILPYINELEDRGLLFDFSDNLQEPVVAMDLDDRIKFISKSEYDLMKLKERIIPQLKEEVELNEAKLWIERNYNNYLVKLSLYNADEIQHITHYLNSLAASTEENLTDIQKEEELLKERTRSSLFRMTYQDVSIKSEQWVKQLNRKASFEEDADGVQKIWDHGKFHFVNVMSEQSLSREGKIMHHCVGGYGYPDKVRRGQVKIFSLRNEDNKPLCTMEVVGGQVKQVKGFGNKEVPAECHLAVVDFLKNYLQVTLDAVNPHDLEKFGFTTIKIENENYYFRKAEAEEIKKALPIQSPIYRQKGEYSQYLEDLRERIGGKLNIEAIITRLTENLILCPVREVYDYKEEVNTIQKVLEFAESNGDLISFFTSKIFSECLEKRKETNERMSIKILRSIKNEFNTRLDSIDSYAINSEAYSNLYRYLSNLNMFFDILNSVEFENIFILKAFAFSKDNKEAIGEFVSSIVSEELNSLVNVPNKYSKIHSELAISVLQLQEIKLVKKLEKPDECTECSNMEIYNNQMQELSTINYSLSNLKESAADIAGNIDSMGELLDELDDNTYKLHQKIKKVLMNSYDFLGNLKIKVDLKDKNQIQSLLKENELETVFSDIDELMDLAEELSAFSAEELKESRESVRTVSNSLDKQDGIMCQKCGGNYACDMNKGTLGGLSFDIPSFDFDKLAELKTFVDSYVEKIEDLNTIDYSSLMINILTYREKLKK